jgi:hypothetical protein
MWARDNEDAADRVERAVRLLSGGSDALMPPPLPPGHSPHAPLQASATLGVPGIDLPAMPKATRAWVHQVAELCGVNSTSFGMEPKRYVRLTRRHMGGHAAHVLHQAFELAFGAVRGKVGNLRLVTADQIGGGVDDAGAKVVDLVGVALQACWKFGGLRVQAHTQQGAVLALGGAQHVKEVHTADFTVCA